jgi:hypothetical protein
MQQYLQETEIVNYSDKTDMEIAKNCFLYVRNDLMKII